MRGPRATWAYLLALQQRRQPRHLGHNPLGAAMIVALLCGIGAIALTGRLSTTDLLWGDTNVERVHRMLGWGLLGLEALHLAGVYLTGQRHHESLVRAMINGRKRVAQAGDVDD